MNGRIENWDGARFTVKNWERSGEGKIFFPFVWLMKYFCSYFDGRTRGEGILSMGK